MNSSIRNFTFTFLKKVLLITFVIGLPSASLAFTDLSFQNTPLKEVISRIQNETHYFFLYRESQIANIRISLESSEQEILDDLTRVLANYNITLSVDENRKQVLLVQRNINSGPSQTVEIKGQVVDAETGERLPFSTLSWTENNQIKGVAANTSGQFVIQKNLDRQSFIVSVSYVGYRKRDIELNLEQTGRIEDLTIRLQPEALKGNEIFIDGFLGNNPSDTLLTRMIDAGRFSPLGESNSIRALQSHPSVSKGTALNNGINVRGSTPDGFLVLLDGMSIFNQSHLFGLLDSFNADAIQSAGYYFDVTPANIDSPTGGTLNLITRTGSRNEYKSSTGISNTSINGTFEGPLNERSSWLLSARGSYMDVGSWFNNTRLIQWGLNIDRPKKVTSNDPDFTDLVLQPGASSAQFIDLHGKIYLETSGRGRFIFNGYLGGDQTSQLAQRRTRLAGAGGEFTFEEVKTSNLWGNILFSTKYEDEIASNLYSSSTVGVSSYKTDFEKDDFVYSRVSNSESNETVTVFTYPFRNRSTMNEFKVNQDFEYTYSQLSANIGATWRYYLGSYSESSFDRPAYFSDTGAHLVNTYLQTNLEPINQLQLDLGGRVYYYSPTNKYYVAPRIQARITPFSPVSLIAGYAINHQFLHRVSLENATTADVWTLSTQEQAPASSEQFSIGLQFNPLKSTFLQLNAYHKNYENLRIHELNTQSLANSFSETPWFYQNSGEAKGVEVILRNRWGRFVLSQTYTLSRMIFKNLFLLEGNEFYAEWDRTHSYNSVLETKITDRLQFNLSWLMMSGAPNSLHTFGNDETERLEAYYRLDTTLMYENRLTESSDLTLSFSIFNLLNRQNVWYRNYSFNFDETRSIPRLTPVPVDVLDLGFQPSFKIQYSF